MAPHQLIDKTIASSSNVLFREWLDCLTSKGIRKHGQFLISGEKAVRDSVTQHAKLARSLFVTAEHLNDPSLHSFISHAKQATERNEPRFSVIELAKALFDELDVSGTRAPILLMRTPEIPEVDLSSEAQGLEIMCAMGDPSNVGALLRSAAAFGASKVILLRESASPFHPKAVRAAAATTLGIQLARGPSIKDLADLSVNGKLRAPVLALDMQGKSLKGYQWPKNLRLLIGEEGQGVPSVKTFEFISIPMSKDVESLNATVAASVALFAFAQSR